MAETSSTATNAMPAPKIKHDWYQTETHVVVEVRIKGLNPAEVKVTPEVTTLSVTAKLPDGSGSEYSLELDLAHPIVPEKCTHKVMSTKLEVKLAKRDGIRWPQLEGDGSDPLAPAAVVSGSSASGSGGSAANPPKYPSSSGKDWNKITTEIEKELAEEKEEGEAALNAMFQKIYADADDDTKKAMNKSFSESGGTVLSTNWKDIGKAKTEVKPPDGMEYKKWDS